MLLRLWYSAAGQIGHFIDLSGDASTRFSGSELISHSSLPVTISAGKFNFVFPPESEPKQETDPL